MEKITKYKSCAQSILAEIVNRKNRPERPVSYQLIADELSANYLLLRNGWQNGHRLYNIIIHVEVKKDGKVWLQQDATDLIIADQLIDKGVLPNDLVLGFLAPAMRADMEIAA